MWIKCKKLLYFDTEIDIDCYELIVGHLLINKNCVLPLSSISDFQDSLEFWGATASGVPASDKTPSLGLRPLCINASSSVEEKETLCPDQGAESSG